MTKKKILVPIDFSPQSDKALAYASDIAVRLNATLSCVYVIESQALKAEGNLYDESKHKLRREAENRLSENVNSVLLKEDKVPFELIITSGVVHEKILEKSIDLNAQLVVMGKSDSTSKNGSSPGSNAKKVIASSMVPVITISDQRIDKRKRLILPIDLDAPYNDQVIWAIETALLLEVSVSVVAVVKKEKSGLRPVYLKKLKDIKSLFISNTIVCNTNLLELNSSISREIISFSNRVEYGIILMMMRQEKNVESPDLGSVAADILLRTEVPVLFINPLNKHRYSKDSSILDSSSGDNAKVPLEDPVI